MPFRHFRATAVAAPVTPATSSSLNLLFNSLNHTEAWIRSSALNFYEKFFHKIGVTTPIFAFIVLLLVVLRVHFKRHIPAVGGGGGGRNSPNELWQDILLRGLFIGAAYIIDQLGIIVIRTLHAVKLRRTSSIYPKGLEGFVFDFPKLFCFLMGRLLSTRISNVMSDWFADITDTSFEMSLRYSIIWLFSFYTVRRLIRNIWLTVKNHNGSANVTYGITLALYLFYLIFDTHLATTLDSLNTAIVGHIGTISPYFEKVGNSYAFLVAFLGLACAFPRNVVGDYMNRFWQLMRYDFQYACMYYVLWEFYDFAAWGTRNNVKLARVNLDLRYPSYFVTFLEWCGSAGILSGAFANFFFLFILKFGELSTNSSLAAFFTEH